VIVAIGERADASLWSDGVTEKAAIAWAKDPLKAMLAEEACPIGSVERSRLGHLTGIHPDLCISLLPPAPRGEAWDAVQAQVHADLLVAWGVTEEARFLLLGKKIMRAFRIHASIQLGAMRLEREVPMLFLPSPSGPARAEGRPSKREQILRWVRAFVAQYGKGQE